MSASTPSPTMIPVWDRFVRLFHWGLVAAVTLAGVTGFLLGPTWLVWHIFGGLVAAALIGARTVAQLDDSVDALKAGPLSGEEIGEIEAVLA